jgi:hypothetical protein
VADVRVYVCHDHGARVVLGRLGEEHWRNELVHHGLHRSGLDRDRRRVERHGLDVLPVFPMGVLEVRRGEPEALVRCPVRIQRLFLGAHQYDSTVLQQGLPGKRDAQVFPIGADAVDLGSTQINLRDRRVDDHRRRVLHHLRRRSTETVPSLRQLHRDRVGRQPFGLPHVHEVRMGTGGLRRPLRPLGMQGHGSGLDLRRAFGLGRPRRQHPPHHRIRRVVFQTDDADLDTPLLLRDVAHHLLGKSVATEEEEREDEPPQELAHRFLLRLYEALACGSGGHLVIGGDPK